MKAALQKEDIDVLLQETMRTANSNEGLAGDVTRSLHSQCFLMPVSKMVCYVEQLAASIFLMIVLMKVRANSVGFWLDGEERPESGSRSWCGSGGGRKDKNSFQNNILSSNQELPDQNFRFCSISELTSKKYLQTGGGKTGGHLGSAAASGLMGRKVRRLFIFSRPDNLILAMVLFWLSLKKLTKHPSLFIFLGLLLDKTPKPSI